MRRHDWSIRLVLAALAVGAASLSAFAEPPSEPACKVLYVSEFVTGEFLLLVEERSEEGYEVGVWSYDAEGDVLQRVMSIPELAYPSPGARLDCCVLAGRRVLYTGGLERETTKTHVGANTVSASTFVGRRADERILGVLGSPPVLLTAEERVLWSDFLLLGKLVKHERSTWWIEMRDPWTGDRLGRLTEDGKMPAWVRSALELSDNRCLILGKGEARLVSLAPLAWIGAAQKLNDRYRAGDGEFSSPDKKVIAATTMNTGFESIGQWVVSYVHLEPDSDAYKIEPLDFFESTSYTQWHNGLRFLSGDGEVTVQSGPIRESVADVVFPCPGMFRGNAAGTHILTYDPREGNTADVWAFTPEGEFAKSSTLTFPPPEVKKE